MKIINLSVIIVSWNTRDLLDKCLQFLQYELSSIAHELFVVDNASSDGSAEMVKQLHPPVHLIENHTNRGFAAANNQALDLASGNYILFLNPDTEVQPGAVTILLEFLKQHPKAGVVAPQLLNTDGNIQRSCREFPTFASMFYELIGLSKLFPNQAQFRHYKMLDWNHNDERQVDQPEGACLMTRKLVIDQIGSFDPDYFMLFEEVDWCYRVKKAGWEIWFTPQAKVIHHYGQSIKQVKAKMILSSHQGLYRFWKKHYCGNRWYLDPIAYGGLMLLAGLRIAAYQLRQITSKNNCTTCESPYPVSR